MKGLVISLALPAWATTLGHAPSMCISSPPIALEAGCSVVSALLDDDLSRRCEATLAFSAPDFLPLSFSFDALYCSGPQITSFVVPAGAPNGDAYITWQCSGLTPTCSYAYISGGSGDLSLQLENRGTVGCVTAALQTHTSLMTATYLSTTVTESQATIFTSTSTRFPNATLTSTEVVRFTSSVAGAMFRCGATSVSKTSLNAVTPRFWNASTTQYLSNTAKDCPTDGTAAHGTAAHGTAAHGTAVRGTAARGAGAQMTTLFQGNSGSKSVSISMLPVLVFIVLAFVVVQTISGVGA